MQRKMVLTWHCSNKTQAVSSSELPAIPFCLAASSWLVRQVASCKYNLSVSEINLECSGGDHKIFAPSEY